MRRLLLCGFASYATSEGCLLLLFLRMLEPPLHQISGKRLLLQFSGAMNYWQCLASQELIIGQFLEN